MALCIISSGSSLIAKVPIYGYLVYKGLIKSCLLSSMQDEIYGKELSSSCMSR